MIRIQDDTLILEINHPCPEDFKIDLKEALFFSLQHQDHIMADPEYLNSVRVTLLELLKNLD